MLKLIIIEAVILTGQIVLYFGSELFQHSFNDVKRPIDDRIPLVPGFAFVYALWFPLVALYPIMLYCFDPEHYVTYQLAIIISNITSVIIYLLYPTTFKRETPPDNFSGRFLRLIYFCSFRGINCSPSLHCTQCFIVIMSVSLSGLIGTLTGIILIFVAASIISSTLFTKQHVIMDLKTSVPVSVWAFAAGWLCFMRYGEAILGYIAGL